MNDVIRYLLKKLPKDTLVNIIINVHESLFTDPKERQEAFREMAAMIQAQEVYFGNRNLDGFTEPFRSEVEAFLSEFTTNDEVIPNLDPKQTCPQCGAMHFDNSYGGCCGPTCESIIAEATE